MASIKPFKTRKKTARAVKSGAVARRREDQLLALEHAVNRCLAKADSLSVALKEVIRAVCETEGWECGRYYSVDEPAKLFRLVEAWWISDPAMERFMAASHDQILPLERGYKGEAWRTGEPLWGRNTARQLNTAAKYLGHTPDTFVFPAKSEGKTVGVLSFLNRKSRQPDARLLQAARVIGGQIGQFVQRKHAEEVLRENEARFRDLAELSSDWYWEQDENLRFVKFTGKTEFDTAGLIGKTRWDLPGLVVDAAAETTVRVKTNARESFHDFEFMFTDPKGAVHYITTSGRPVFDASGRFIGYRGVAKDVTARKRAEQLRELEHTVNRSLALADGVSDGLKGVIRTVCETEGWECGRYFRADESAGVLRFSDAWGVPDPAIERFVEESRGRVYPRGCGLSGTVWQSGQPLWSADVTKDARTSRTSNRTSSVIDIGMRGAFVFPVMSGGKAIGVLNFASRKPREPERQLLEAIDVIGRQIGQFLQRKQAEEVQRQSETRFRSLTNLSSDWFWEQDAEFRFTRLEGRHVTGDNSVFQSEIGKTREQLGVEVDGGWDAHRASITARQPFRDVVMWRTSTDGQRYYMSISGEPIFDNANRFVGYRGVGKDITERRHGEQLLALEHAVNRCLADAKSASEAIKTSIRSLCETQGWECGRYFRVDEKAGLLRFAEAWGIPDDPSIERYIAASRDVTYTLGAGMNGKVWQTREALWVSERGQHAGVSQAVFGKKRDVFLFPLIADGKVVGVLNFISRKLRTPEARLLQAVRVIGSQIGQFVQRKQAEQTTLRLARMFAALSGTNDAIVHAKSPEELYQQVCNAAVNGGRFSNTSIFLAEPGAARTRAVAGAGQIPHDVTAAYISTDESIPEGRGLVGEVFRTQKPCISNDFLNDARTRPWHDLGRKAGCRSAAALPLIQSGRSVGIILIHDGELNAFDDEIIKLLERMAANVSFALDNFAHDAERRRAQERIQYLATHDGLTDLPNRVMFSQVLNLAIESARRYKRHFAVLFLDLDRFKIINDTLGHEAGDTLLQEMSKRIQDSLRASDVVARLGGDEFVMLAQEVSEPEQVAIVARKLLSAVIKPVMILGQECRITASIGISMYPTDAQDEQALMKNADIAMYLAKEEGKNNFQFYSKDIKTQSLERLSLETSLRRALEREEFFLHYQAKVDLTTGAITGVEALLRWKHPDLGMVSPAQFIPLAEETGLIVPIGKWVLRTACAENVAWQRAGLKPVCMAVNLSPRQFADENLLKDLAAVFQETGMAPELLELEITESMVMGNVDRAARQLNAIKEMGVRLAIDDFGTGYSSLAQIKRFPIDTIKVDRSFIREIPQDAEDKAITEAIIAMGKSLSLTVVAEGVETLEQQTFLQEHACNEMQGYYFSKPVAPEQFAELLRTHVPVPKK